MIPREFIQDLLNRVDIVEVVERYLPLKRAGANYKACCPFHSEKTPSFTVSPSKQFYHCFGCGAHGTAISFLMEYSGLSFVDAVKDLAAAAGMTVPETSPRVSKPSEAEVGDLYGVLDQAARYYREQLKGSQRAIAYLKGRGVEGAVAARFGIGYAPEGWQSLAECFPDYNSRVLELAGLVVQGESGKRYDRFRDRVIFPILDPRGRVIGFGARVIGAGEPKYLNSPETPLFEKGRELYGIAQARRAIREAGRVLVVEGYMDVVALAQHGIEYAVATLGTATTSVQVQKLLRQADSVVFCFDGDEAGQHAAWRALENALAQVSDGKEIAFLFLPHGEDPDSLVRKEGKAGFERRLAEAVPLSAFLLRELARRADLRTEEGRARLLKEARPLVTRIAAPALGLMVRRRLAQLAGVTLAELEELYQIKSVSFSRPPAERARGPRPISLYRRLLRVLLFDPAFAPRVGRDLLEASGSEGEAVIALLDFVAANPHVKREDMVPLIEHFADSRYLPLYQELAQDIVDWSEGFDVEAEFSGIIAQLLELRARRRIDELLSKPLSDLTPAERQEYLRLISERGGAGKVFPEASLRGV